MYTDTHIVRFKITLVFLLSFLCFKNFCNKHVSCYKNQERYFKANQDFPQLNPSMQRVCQYTETLPKLQLPSGAPGQRCTLRSRCAKTKRENSLCPLEIHRRTVFKLTKATYVESVLKISKTGKQQATKSEQIDQIEHVIIVSYGDPYTSLQKEEG